MLSSPAAPTLIFTLHRTSKARFWPLVDFLFLRKAEPAWHAERTRTSEVSVCNIWTEPRWCQAQALTFLCTAGTGPTRWPTVRWPASPRKWFWKDNSARPATAEGLNPRPLQKLYPRPPGPRPHLAVCHRDGDDGGLLFAFIFAHV